MSDHISDKRKLRILFLCTGNSCRSQMAEGWARALHGGSIEPHSAGVAPTRLDPRAVRVMGEAGVDISGQRAKGIEELSAVSFDQVVTICDDAREACPWFAGAPILHKGFADPPFLARDAVSEEEALMHYRRVRDEIRAFVERLPEMLASSGKEMNEFRPSA